VISVSVSGFIALTVTPAMCAVLLRHNPTKVRFFIWFNRQVDRVTQAFGVAVTYVIKFAVIALILLVVFLYSIYHIFKILPTSFVPNEDQGYAFAAIIMPQAASLSRTEDIAKRADDIFKDIPGVQTRTVVTGYSLLDSGFKTNSATIFVTFKDFEERYKNVDTAKAENVRAILQGFFAKARNIEGAIVIPIAPPAIPGIGTTGGFEFWIQDTGTGDPVALDGVMQDFLKKARERPSSPGSPRRIRPARNN
jgi:multidrug efflux pump